MSKKTIGWVIGSIVVLGAGGYALARYNTNSMAHVIYQEIVLQTQVLQLQRENL